jgi:hypothetical protein
MLPPVESTWDELTASLGADDLAMFTLYRTFCRDLPDVEEQVHTSQVQYRVRRIFTSGYMKSHYLEIGLELLREASHPSLRTAFPTSKTVIMHRLTLRAPEQFDDDLRALIDEARTTVGPGLRRSG